MASAGRILIMPKGNYDSSVTYEMLDLVNHNGKSWLAKKMSVGIEPSDANSEYWQNMFNISAESIGALSKNGGTMNGNIVIDTQWATLSLRDDSGRRVFIEKNPATNVLSIYNYLDGENHNNLMLMPETTNIEECLYLRNVVDGVAKVYQMFGEHNPNKLKQSVFITKTYSGTTDANGFLMPVDITVDNAKIVSCNIVNGIGFCTPFCDANSLWSFKFENSDRTPIANKLATVKVTYMTI